VKYLLDTNICIYWLKGNDQLEQKIISVGLDNVVLSFINVSELYYGAYKSQKIDANLAMVRRLTNELNVLESDEAINEEFGNIKAILERSGTIIDDADLFIAACVKVHGLTLVTNNSKHFKRIKGLKLENWLEK
jgi:tRNA(fMet)-specific endonuclease VapC